MKRTFKTEVLLTQDQQQKANQTIGVCRYVYNLYLVTAQNHYKETKKHLSGFAFSKWLNNVHTKQTDQWIKDVSSKAVKQAIMNGDSAYKNFFNGLAKFPRFKKKSKQDVKAYFPKNNASDLTVERHRVKIPTFGWLRLKEFGYIPTNAIVINCTLSQKAGRYFISVLCDVEKRNAKYENVTDGIGVDLGLKEFAVCSNHLVFENINKQVRIIKLEKQLKRHQRKLSRSYNQNKNRKEGEFCAKNRQKQLLVVQILHARLANIRKEYIRYVVSVLVKTKPAYIAIEDLNVKGMMGNRHLARTIAKQNFKQFRELLVAKCLEIGIKVRLVDRWYPSSKNCSGCNNKNVSLSLADRIFTCENCGLEMNRDFNASLNLKYTKEYTVITE
ncbi:transposase [Sporosarcina sp. Marseille-Q4063]|uniref:RNA-guided endonuclease InsQ/TnpB family protein n=1 Tax=Sporosarcina sp. Marseille-Q4063 TaxID=2810514 RepID=UPI001BB0488A|nr:RNA-guided endonuclease TnpB family protein [Sporosarcina sp. Marseille-Q4063]QUW22396.1 transposase [Sporosarcina sp. Marseille-Q4063]